MPTRTKADYLNMLHSQAQSHFRTQQTSARATTEGRPGINPFRIFISVNVWGWVYHYLKSRVGKKHPFADYSQSTSKGVFKMVSASDPHTNDHIKMVIVADWATDTPESNKVATLMREQNSDYSIHLGDVYFVGAPQEIQDNFIGPAAPWPRGRSGSLAVPGNHEYYSNGNPFFDRLLPHLFARRPAGEGNYLQDASFFCLENDHWRVVALDNGYYSVGPLLLEYIIRPDAHLDDRLIAWLQKEIAPKENDNRGVIILSHIQYCSAFEPQYPKTAEVLKQIFGDKEVIWLWGHEHRFAVYGKYYSKDGITAYGRCIGHGGMPIEIGKVRSGRERYKKPDPNKMKRCPLVFYDNRKKEIVEKTILGHNGYVILTLNGNRLNIEYKDSSTWLFREEWEVDGNGRLSGNACNNPDIPLTLVAPSYDDAVSPAANAHIATQTRSV
jgi:hypothetical protein